MTELVVGIRCAAWAREERVAPAGTAPQADVFVLVEHPLPWPKDIGDDPLLAGLDEAARAAAGERSVRVQALVCEPGQATRRVVVLAAGPSPFRGFGRLEAEARVDELAGVVAALVAAEPPPPAQRVTDVLVCTHGSRDTCCGSLGTRLFLDAGHPEAGPELDGVRVWRTSHTGGHRFAPTAVTFPDGNYWAHLDREVLEGIVTRSLPAADAASHLRGCAAFTPAVQVAEAAVLAERGWAWLDAARFVGERSERRVELCFEVPGGERGTYDVVLEEGRRLPVPDCGKLPDVARKFQVELRVARLQAWD